MNSAKLRSIMVLHGDKVSDLAKLLNRTEQTIYNKLSEDGTEFTQGEIAKIKDRYHLTMEEVDAIFFNC